jgi:hypothetical protein
MAAVVTKVPVPANVWQGTVDFYIDSTPPSSEVTPTQADEIALDANGQPASLQMAVTAATNASPIVITGASTTGFALNDIVTVASVTGNTNANGIWTISALDATHITLKGSAGNAAWISGGTVTRGAHVGLLEGPTTVTLNPKIEDIGSDSFEGPHDAALQNVEVDVETVMKEVDLYKLLAMTSNLNYGNFAALPAAGAYTTLGVQFGGVQSASMNLHRLMFVGPNRAAAGKWIYVYLFKGYNSDPIQLTFHRSKANLWKVKFMGVADLTRALGDELCHVVKTK